MGSKRAAVAALAIGVWWSSVGIAGAEPGPAPGPPPGPPPASSSDPAPGPAPVPGPVGPAGPAAGAPGGIHADGSYRVGTDIMPGTYSSAGPVEGGTCYWKRVSGDRIVDNAMTKRPQVVQIEATDTVFKTDHCQPWLPSTESPQPAGLPGLPVLPPGFPIIPGFPFGPPAPPSTP